jgi:hypothetical protein
MEITAAAKGRTNPSEVRGSVVSPLGPCFDVIEFQGLVAATVPAPALLLPQDYLAVVTVHGPNQDIRYVMRLVGGGCSDHFSGFRIHGVVGI